jgi:hypothetical protein
VATLSIDAFDRVGAYGFDRRVSDRPRARTGPAVVDRSPSKLEHHFAQRCLLVQTTARPAPADWTSGLRTFVDMVSKSVAISHLFLRT